MVKIETFAGELVYVFVVDAEGEPGYFFVVDLVLVVDPLMLGQLQAAMDTAIGTAVGTARGVRYSD